MSEDRAEHGAHAVTCLDCGRAFDKEIAAAWHEDQTGHDNWSDAEDANAE